MGGGVLGDRVRRSLGDVDRCGEAVRRPRPRAAVPAAPGVEAGHGRWLAAVAGAPGRREDPPAHPRRGFVCGPARGADRAPDRTGPARPAGRRGDRPLHARRGRTPPPRARRTGGTSPSSPARCNSYDGTLAVHGELDIADAMELETAIQTVAAQLKELGSTESLDVRRSMAVGELARRELALELSVVEEGAPRPSRNHPRKIVLYVHLSQDVLTARLEHGNHLITGGQLSSCAVRPTGGRETRPRPDRPRPGRHTRGAGPAPRGDRGPGPDLCLPLVHPTRRVLRRRPHRPLITGRAYVSVQRSLTLQTDITGSRRSPAGPTRRSMPVSISGRARTATATCATPPAPTTSPPPDHRAPDPAAPAGLPACPARAGGPGPAPGPRKTRRGAAPTATRADAVGDTASQRPRGGARGAGPTRQAWPRQARPT